MPIDPRHHTITPHIVLDNCAAAIEFYKKAFGAEEICRSASPDGQKIMHAEIKIGDSSMFMADDFPEWGMPARNPKALKGSPVTLHLNVANVDASMARAVAAGATPTMPIEDMFWGDRYGKCVDPFGHEWSMATHLKDMTGEEIEAAAKAFFANFSGECGNK